MKIFFVRIVWRCRHRDAKGCLVFARFRRCFDKGGSHASQIPIWKREGRAYASGLHVGLGVEGGGVRPQGFPGGAGAGGLGASHRECARLRARRGQEEHCDHHV